LKVTLHYKVNFKETIVSDREKDLSTILEDVQTIKNILTNQDAPFPQVWKALYTAASTLILVALIQYFVPFYRLMDFDGLVLWLWLPGFCLLFPTVLAILLHELKVSGKGVLSQARVRHLLYARWVVPPAILVILWTASRNPVFAMEGVALILVAVWQTVLEQILPPGFRFIPPTFLALGVIELLLNARGPEVVLLNILITAGAVVFAATLLRRSVRKDAGIP
jgi:hypothetical protein